MAIEIERKFVVISDDWREAVTSSQDIVQGYLTEDEEACVRIRLGEKCWLTVKGRGDGISRPEFEYEIPREDAEEMLKLCHYRVLSKRRHIVPFHGWNWEIDVFKGRHEGLVIAEIELTDAAASFDRPPWIADEVTGNERYANQSLACNEMSAYLWSRP